MMGKLFVVEGLDGCGKGTVATQMLKWFEDRNLPVYHSFEPGGSPFANALRKELLSKEHDVPPMAEVLGMYCARIEHTQNVLIPKLQAGINVVCERYYMSSIAYNHAAEVFDVHALCKPYILEPDATILLDVDTETSMQRVRNRKIEKGEEPDRIELKPRAYFDKVRSMYMNNLQMIANFHYIDGEQSREDVAYNILEVLASVMDTE